MTTLNESRAWANAFARSRSAGAHAGDFHGRPADHAAYAAATRSQAQPQFGLTASQFVTACLLARQVEQDEAEFERSNLHGWALDPTPPSPWSRFRAWVKEQVS